MCLTPFSALLDFLGTVSGGGRSWSTQREPRTFERKTGNLSQKDWNQTHHQVKRVKRQVTQLMSLLNHSVTETRGY